MLLQDNSTNDREKRYNLELQQNVLLNVLHPPVETATQSGPSAYHAKTESSLRTFPN
jgi:hypothetical protein